MTAAGMAATLAAIAERDHITGDQGDAARSALPEATGCELAWQMPPAGVIQRFAANARRAVA
jgi:hypothetical protein